MFMGPVHVFKTGTSMDCSMGGGDDAPAITHRLDVLGFNCPVPVAKTREALEGLEDGNVLEVLADDPETLHDMPMLIGRSLHTILHVAEEEGEIRFVIEVKK